MVRKEVHYCAFEHLSFYHKPTHIWTNMIHWIPTGSTEDGLCGQKCSGGFWRGGGGCTGTACPRTARVQGLFGRHAADAMKWSGGRGGCWSPPGYHPGWCHLRKWSSSGMASVTKISESVLETSETSQRGALNRVRRRVRRDRLLRSSSGAWQSGSSRSTTPSRMGAKWEAVGKRLA